MKRVMIRYKVKPDGQDRVAPRPARAPRIGLPVAVITDKDTSLSPEWTGRSVIGAGGV